MFQVGDKVTLSNGTTAVVRKVQNDRISIEMDGVGSRWLGGFDQWGVDVMNPKFTLALADDVKVVHFGTFHTVKEIRNEGYSNDQIRGFFKDGLLKRVALAAPEHPMFRVGDKGYTVDGNAYEIVAASGEGFQVHLDRFSFPKIIANKWGEQVSVGDCLTLADDVVVSHCGKSYPMKEFRDFGWTNAQIRQMFKDGILKRVAPLRRLLSAGYNLKFDENLQITGVKFTEPLVIYPIEKMAERVTKAEDAVRQVKVSLAKQENVIANLQSQIDECRKSVNSSGDQVTLTINRFHVVRPDGKARQCDPDLIDWLLGK